VLIVVSVRAFKASLANTIVPWPLAFANTYHTVANGSLAISANVASGFSLQGAALPDLTIY
jgi:hypothetical protein